MSTRKNGKLKRIIALVVNLQLVFTTCAFAKNEDRDNAFNGFNQVMGVATGVAGAALQGMQQAQQQQMQAYTAQMVRQTMSLQMANPAQTPPFLAQSGCVVLGAKPNLPSDRCQDYDPQKAQSGYYASMIEVARDNANDIENFLTSAHEKYTSQGVGCYEKALKSFQAQLNARLEAVNKLEEAIERELEVFTAATKQELEGVKNLNAELTGKPAARAKDKKWEKEFSDTQCASFMNSEVFKKSGKSGGYKAINDLLAQKAQSPGKGALAATDLKAQQNAIKKEVRQIAQAVGRHASRKKTIEGIDPAKLGIRSKFVDSKNPAIVAIISSSATQAQSDLEDLQNETLKGIDPADKEAQGIMKEIVSDRVDLDNALYNYERAKKNNCFNTYLASNFGGVSGLSAKLQDPNISKKANQESDSAFKNSITTILSDNEYTMEEKLQLIKEEESKSGNARYSFTTGKSVNIKGKQIGASTRLRASDMLSIFSDNCKERFEKQRNSRGKSSRSVVNSLRGFKNGYKRIQNQYSSKIADNIITGMLECPADTTTGKGAGTCTGESLNPSNTSFCLRTANTCASNMLACRDKAEKIFDNKRNEQKALAESYNNKMKVFKGKLVTAFQSTNKILEASARQLDGMYQMGSIYNVPVGLDLNMIQDKIMKGEGIDPALMMENPEEYKKLMKNNIAKLKESIKKSNDEILNGPKNDGDTVVASAGQATEFQGVSGEVKKYLSNYEKQLDEFRSLADACQGQLTAYNESVAQQNEQIAEQNAQRNEMCSKIAAFNENPAGFCGEAASLGDEVLKIAAVSGDRAAAADLKAFDAACDSFGSENGTNMYDSFGGNGRSVASVNIKDFCDEYTKENRDDTSADRACKALEGVNRCNYSGDTEAQKTSRLIAFANQNKYCYKLEEDKFITAECKDDINIKFQNEAPSGAIKSLESKTSIPLLQKICKLDEELEQDKDYSGAVALVESRMAQDQRAKYYEDIGYVTVSQCGSVNNSGFGKELIDFGGQALGRGLAGGDPLGAAGLEI